MKKGINIWSFPPLALKDCFALAKDAGFEGVEVALNVDGEITLAVTDQQLQDIRLQAQDAGVALPSVACSMYLNNWLSSDNPQEQEKTKDIVKKQLDIAAALGSESILVIPGCVNADFAEPGRVMNYAVAYEKSLEALRELRERAEACQVEIAVENVWNKFLLSPLEMRDFIDKVDSRYVGSYLDVGNALQNGYPEQWIEILGSRIKKVHFKDYRLAAGGLHGFVDLLAGDVNFPAVVEALNRIGYDGWVTAEMIPNYKYHTKTIIYNTSRAMDAILGRVTNA